MKQEHFAKIVNEYSADRVVKDTCDDHLKDRYLYTRIRYRFEELESLKILTELIDCGCSFDVEGCRKGAGEKCCCSSCKSAFGHFHIIRQSNVAKLAWHFNEKTGFWRKGRGCILPRKLRSITCVTYHCSQDEKIDKTLHALSRAMRLVTARIKEHVKELKEKGQY